MYQCLKENMSGSVEIHFPNFLIEKGGFCDLKGPFQLLVSFMNI